MSGEDDSVSDNEGKAVTLVKYGSVGDKHKERRLSRDEEKGEEMKKRREETRRERRRHSREEKGFDFCLLSPLLCEK